MTSTLDPTPALAPPDARATAVHDGLAFLQAWLSDLMRHGLGAPAVRDPATFEAAARRLVDAKAPGLARQLRLAAALTAEADAFEAPLLAHLGRLALAAQAMHHEAALPAPLRADLRAFVGWTTPRADVLAGPLVADRWWVLGARALPEPGLRARRTWLLGHHTARAAFVLEFGPAHQPLPTTLFPGDAFDGQLAFYPGAAAQRALVATGTQVPADWAACPARGTLTDALTAHAALLSRAPFAEAGLALLAPVTVDLDAGRPLVRDPDGLTLPVAPRAPSPLTLAAASAGRPLALAAEWDGHALHPLAAWSADGHVALTEDAP